MYYIYNSKQTLRPLATSVIVDAYWVFHQFTAILSILMQQGSVVCMAKELYSYIIPFKNENQSPRDFQFLVSRSETPALHFAAKRQNGAQILGYTWWNEPFQPIKQLFFTLTDIGYLKNLFKSRRLDFEELNPISIKIDSEGHIQNIWVKPFSHDIDISRLGLATYGLSC